jgi:hypothetical protein
MSGKIESWKGIIKRCLRVNTFHIREVMLVKTKSITQKLQLAQLQISGHFPCRRYGMYIFQSVNLPFTSLWQLQ